MSLLSVVRDVCLAIGVNPPASMFSPVVQPRTQSELLSLANEMAQRISYDTREWTRLKAQCELVGDGIVNSDGSTSGSIAFNLPEDFKRMLLTANVWRSSYVQAPMLFVPDTDDWFQRRAAGFFDSRGEWTLMGGQMHIVPLMLGPTAGPSATKATFPYLSKNCVALNSGGFGDTFTNDADSFVLGERLLKLGMIWQWKANKGSPYAEDMGTYSDALVIAMGNDSPAPIIGGGMYTGPLDAHIR